MDLKLYRKHRENVVYVQPRIDNKPPKFSLDVYYNEDKLKEIATRVKLLDDKNMDLLKKLNIVRRSSVCILKNPKTDSWNKLVPIYEDKLKDRLKDHKHILEVNKEMLIRIKQVDSKYSRAKILKDWEKNKALLEKKYPNPLRETDGTQFSIIKEPSKIEDPKLRTKCFFDVQVLETKQNLGRIVFELYSDYVPRTCANFEELCRGTNGHSYKGTEFYRILSGYWCQGGDVTKINGTGGSSIYGDNFEDENFTLKHAGRGVISMWRDGKNTNNSKFNITFRKLETIDGKRVVFGKIVRGLKNLSQIEEHGTESGQVLKRVIVANCGILKNNNEN
ncbi:peptidyl-prolyl cis-trans isomerase-like isoform X2 [Belonocnema kinseyi]|uniref:peptidyl-prolyl cis-trans isomerase-like isoform X2 n=1 Tax=Belonocnema kinseyi TaxID=2817044 RepID=UPI00143CC1DB|nr:peptidyl-prolyl cis-trans isomerase-like isoform X2 [Belonocnema kinseyi]